MYTHHTLARVVILGYTVHSQIAVYISISFYIYKIVVFNYVSQATTEAKSSLPILTATEEELLHIHLTNVIKLTKT